MTTYLGNLWDAMQLIDHERIGEIVDWGFLLDGTELGDALLRIEPMTLRLCAAQTAAFLAIQGNGHMSNEVVSELIAAAAEALG